MVMKTFIYILENPITNEIRYVGKTNNPKNRLHYHWTVGIKSNNKTGQWLKSLKNNKTKPVMTIIDETENDWQNLEMYWISQFKAWGFDLTNHTEGGEGCYGGGDWNCKEISIYDKKGDYIKTYPSLKECCSDLVVSNSAICSVLSGRNKLLQKKYQVKYGHCQENIGLHKSRKQYKWVNKPKNHWSSRKIKCNEDNLTFNSISEASNHYNILITSIHNILNGRSKKTKNGLSFSYI
jgi:hypothetical protein